MGLPGKKKEIGPDTIIQRRNDLLFNEIDGEVVMLSVENGEYYGMDHVGSRIWALLKYPISLRNLLNELLIQYNVTEKQCIKDTLGFLDKLKERKLLIIN